MGVLQYYSVHTHTIYPPTLELKWNDFTFNTGSSTQTILTDPQAYISIMDNEGFFYPESVQQFRIDSRPQFPAIIFQTASIYTTNYYLPTASYWAIKDLDTNEYVIDFDTTYTKISADATSSFFTVYMNGLQPERYYTTPCDEFICHIIFLFSLSKRKPFDLCFIDKYCLNKVYHPKRKIK